MPQNYTGRILTIVVVVLAALWAIVPKPADLFRSDLSLGQKINLKPGIDMQGGTSLLYEIKPPEGQADAPATTTYQGGLAEEVMGALKKRIDPEGVKNLIWRPHGDTRLEIQLPATAASQQAAEFGKQLNDAREALERTNVTPGEVVAAVEHSADAAARDKRLAELAGGSKPRQEIFKELVAAWEKLQQARKDQNAEAAADAQQAYTQAQARIKDTNLRPADLETALEMTGAERQQRLEAFRKNAAEFPARAQALDQYVASFDAFAKVRNQIDDVADLKRKLRGAGVLEFHILADDVSQADLTVMTERLQAEGPRATDGRLKWFEVDRPDAVPGNAPVATYNGKPYALAWITPEKSLDHRQGGVPWALAGARAQSGQFGEATVGFSFNPVGGRLFGDLTGANLKRPLAVMLDKRIISAPTINSRISDSGEITSGSSGGFSADEMQYLVSTLNAGSLKAQLADEPISERTIGPQLGADNLRRGLIACVFGLVVVAFFLIGYYYLSGVVATLAVMLNMVLLLGAMAVLNATFTLPSIAGIVLTIGMAVDANVLIFERLREEQVRGLSIRMALRNAYDRAFSAILDGNVTTGITAAVLYVFGSEEVKGFGLTLLIGIAASMFTALFVTKTLFGLLIDRFNVRKLGSLPLTFPRWDRALRPNIDWMSKAWIAYTFSGIVIVLGLTAFGVRLAQGKMLDVEFTKGTSVQFDLTDAAAKELDQSEVRELVEEQSRKTPEALPSPQVVSSGGSGTSYEVITPNENAAQVRQAVVEALGPHLKVEQPSSFANVGSSLDAAIAAGTVLPIESATQELAGFTPRRLPAHLGGAAIVLKDLRPALGAQEVKDRIERQRLQADSPSEGGGYRALDVEEAPAKGPNGENTVVVMVSDPAILHDVDPLKLQQWKDNVAGPMWQTVNEAVNKAAELQRVTNFDAQVAGETQRDAMLALFLSILGIMAYIWVRFGNLRYGTATVVALLHDTLFVLAAVGLAHYMAEIGFFRNVLLIEPFRINLTMVAAVLTVMGYSMNDTVVVFDRIRENRGRLGVVSRQVINDSINQTLSRTLLTGGTTILTILVMYLFGGSGIHGFTFALLVGIVVGTYSSIAIASPILLFGQGRDAEGRSSQEIRKSERPATKLEGVGAS